MNDQLKELENKPLFKELRKNIEVLNPALGVKKSFDVICRELHYGGKDMALYFVDGFAKDDIMNRIMDHLTDLPEHEFNKNPIQKLLTRHIGYLEVEEVDTFGKIITSVLSGPLVLVIDGQDKAIQIDARTYPARGPDEPDIERVVRGARDGFVETLIFNTALTRRRLRDPSLRMEYHSIGKRSKTDICISYIEDIANPELVEEIRKRIKAIDVDGFPMAEKSIEEFMFKSHWNPFPLVRYTERPDVAAVHLLEGHVLIYCDTSPSVMITPTTFWHHVQHAEEYRQKPVVGAFLRWVRFIAMIASVFILPLWLLVSLEPSLLPKDLQFIGPEKVGHVPLFWQIIFAELGIEVLRMAAIHTPSPLATAMGLVAAIVIGQVAVEVGLFANEVILYIAIAAIGTFATPSYELSLANRIVRIFLLISVVLFKLIGFIVAIAFVFLVLAFMKSIKTPYLWPLIPFNGSAMMHILVRSPVPTERKRPAAINPQDPDRL